ncbi:hypothetical protein [Geminocystis herdmanii]|uniref:hypothetical protein n=1 Tax=Geminocystis herdmanii TaxID=669359 RepID=UPI00036ABC22|nr:hypothetical protein [Geminocystis herdmanii]
MVVKFRKHALKFLQKTTGDDVSQIQSQLRQLIISIEEKSIIPFTELDIKKLKYRSNPPLQSYNLDRTSPII